MKKAVSFLLCIVTLMGLLSACGDKASTNDSLSGAGASVITRDDVSFVENGESVYDIVRPAESTELDELTPAAFIYKQAKAVLGVNIKNLSDESDGTDKYEILIGATNRPESKQALDYLITKDSGRYNDWIVCTIGKKIVINAYNAEKLDEAAKYFINNFLKSEGVKGGIEYAKIEKGDFADILINNVEIKKFNIVRPRFNFSYLAQVELEKLLEYAIAKTGFALPIVHDNTDSEEYEIVVGNAARDGVEALTDHDAYSIKISGKKIYINGGSVHSTALAISEFVKMLEKGSVTDTAVSGAYTETIKNYGDDTFKYAWGDDFDGDALDTTKWYQMNKNESAAEGQHGKRSVRNTDPNYVFVRNGKFHICATQDEKHYYGGMIRTTNIMMYKYGYAEISAVVPHGPAFWVAFWASKASADPTMSNTDPNLPMWMRPEIDIMEMFGNSASYAANGHRWPTATGKEMGYEHTSLDGKQYGQSKKYTHPDAGGRLTDDFHTYGFLWDDTQIAFTCDGELFFKYDTTTKPEDIECFNHEMYLILSMALGYASRSVDIATATDDEWYNTNKFIIDYCNIYQQNDGKSYIRYLK
jgi:beta-glucanase (GH16 family)